MKHYLPLTKFTKWHFLIVSILVLGVCFRFFHLDRKVYWYDEVFTSFRIFGYTETEVIQQVSASPIVSVEDLQQYQHDSGRNLINTIQSLATEDFHHPPVYYAIAHFWVKLFGDSIAVIRSLSALISLLAFPAIYWLCRELFPSPSVAWVSMALVAVSPFHVLMAQEARQYSLWTVTILLSSASLLRAIRLNSKQSWRLYAISLILGLYTFLFTGLVAIAHGLYLFYLRKSLPFSKAIAAYSIAVLTTLLAFIPWLVIVAGNFTAINSNVNKDNAVALVTLIKTWIFNLSYIFFDAQWQLNQNSPAGIPLERGFDVINIIVLLFLFLVLYSLHFLYRTAPKPVSLFILISIAVPAGALILPDLILGGHRSLTMRYLIPSYVAVQVAVAYLLATKLENSFRSGQQRTWQLLLLISVSASILSCMASVQAETWWHKGSSANNPQVAKIINQAKKPLLISDTKVGRIVSLSYLLEPKVKFQLQPQCHTCQIKSASAPVAKSHVPNDYSEIFLYRPSSEMLDNFKQMRKSQLELTYEPASLWRLEYTDKTQ
jgi:uncharacterized membrane protein